MGLLQFVFKYFHKNKKLLIFILSGNFFTFLLALVIPYLNGFYLDMLIYDPTKEKIIKFGGLIAGIGIIATVLSYCFNVFKAKVQKKVVFNSMNEIIKHIQMSDFAESSKYNPSYLNQKLNIDTNKIWSFFFDNVINSIFHAFNIVFVAIALAQLNIKIFIIILFIIPIYIFSYYCLKKPLYEKSNNYKENQSIFYKQINEQFEFVKNIKLWVSYTFNENKRIENFHEFMNGFMGYTKILYFYNSLESIITVVFKSIALIIGGFEIIYGRLSLGEFLIISSYFGILIKSIKFFFSFGQMYQDSQNSYDWLNKMKGLSKEHYGEKILTEKINEINLTELNFSYKDKEIFSNFTHKLLPGINQLVGANGSGKSTLIYLISGLLHTNSEGGIEYNDSNIEDINIESLRQNKISIYIQNQIAMDVTVKEMLLEYLSIETLAEAIHKKRLDRLYLSDDFNVFYYLEKPMNELSGGEKQRIQLLPVLLKETDIMILDEPTSDLDIKAKEILSEILLNYSQEKIIIIATHEKKLFKGISDINTIYLNK